MRSAIICYSILILASYEAVCQHKNDSIAIAQSREKVLTLYERAMEGIHHLYNGSEYVEYEPLDNEHPYFETGEWTYSDLKYDGEWFRNVPLLLDIDKDKLITSYYYNAAKMALVQSRVSEFTIADHHFINIKLADSISIPSGFYELLYNGHTKVLAKRSKNYVEKIEGTEEFRSFKEKNQILIMTDARLYKMGSRREIIQIFKSRKNEVKGFIRRNNLFNNNKEASTILVAKYFDSLIQK